MFNWLLLRNSPPNSLGIPNPILPKALPTAPIVLLPRLAPMVAARFNCGNTEIH